MPNVRIRVISEPSDITEWAAVKNELVPHDRVSVEELEQELARDPTYRLYLATIEDRVVGSGVGRLSRAAPDTLFAMARVPPEQRRRGVGSAIFATLSDEARRQGLGHLLGRIDEGDTDALAWADRRGLTEIARDSTLMLTLADVHDGSRPALPESVEIVSLAERPDLASAAHRIESEAIRDIPGPFPQAPVSFEDWMAENVDLPGFLPEASFVALSDQEPVGYAGLKQNDETLAGHLLTGVLPSARGRGIATALKRAQIAWAKGAGYEHLVTWTSSRNDPMRGTNLKLGYIEGEASIAVRGPVEGTQAPA